MATLNHEEVRQLAATIQDTLSTTPYSCHTLTRVAGGSASFTFRGVLRNALTFAGGPLATTVIVKKATDFAAINRNFALDSERSEYEDLMLRTLQHTSFSPKAGAISTTTPRRIFYDRQTQTEVIEDLQPARDLANIITCQDNIELLQSDHATLGFSLGSWLRHFHSWTEEPAQIELRRSIAYATSSQNLKWRTTYDTICAIVEPFSNISKDEKRVLEQVRVRALQEYQQDTNVSLVHGDFWTGNVLFTSSPCAHLYIIDWEFAHLVHRAVDLGQMIGDLLEKGHVSGAEHTSTVIEAFVKGYGDVDEDMAYRVIVHSGVHLINWCSRHPGAELHGKVREVIKLAIDLIMHAWKENRAWFAGGLLACLFSEAK